MKKYGLIGKPLGHSFSKGYFNEKFSNENIDAEYVNFEIPTIDDLPAVIAENKNLCGLNVTIPYKEKVISYLDEVTTDARAIGAVNVIRIERNAKGEPRLIGYNSDIVGFTQSIEPMLENHHKKALILGTGGASKATVQYKDITPEVIQEYNVIVNCTPCGMYPHTDECPDLPYEAITEKNLLYDLIYNPDQTLFMRKGAERGAKVKNGLEMLLLQAFDSWRFWNSTRY